MRGARGGHVAENPVADSLESPARIMDPQTAGVASPDVLLESLHPLIRRTVARLLPRRGPVDPDDVASGVVLDLLRVLRSE